MKIHTLEKKQLLPISREEAWAFFSNPRNLDEITPADLGFRIVSCPGERMYEGQVITYKVKLAPMLWISWVTEIKAVEGGVAFVDEQRFGPYKFWLHRHSFEDAEGGVLMRDLVHYSLGFGPIGTLVHALFVRRKLEWIFSFRRKVLAERFGE